MVITNLHPNPIAWYHPSCLEVARSSKGRLCQPWCFQGFVSSPKEEKGHQNSPFAGEEKTCQVMVLIWLVVSTHLKNVSQNGNLPQVGVKLKNI